MSNTKERAQQVLIKLGLPAIALVGATAGMVGLYDQYVEEEKGKEVFDT